MKSKSRARFSAATITMTTLMPMPRGDGSFQNMMSAPKREAIQPTMNITKMPPVAATIIITNRGVTLMMRVA